MTRNRPFLAALCLLASLGMLLPLIAADKLPDAPDSPLKSGVALPSEATFKAEVEAYRKLVTDLAAPEMEGRGPATKGLDLARDYLVAEFRKIDLQPAFRAAGEAGPSFTQEFTISAGIRVKAQKLVLVDAEGKELRAPKSGEHYEARGFSGDGKGTAPAVFVGYGVYNKELGYNSFGDDKELLKGKVAVAFRYEPVDGENKPILIPNGKAGQYGDASNLLSKAKWAAERGAIALVVVDPPTRDKGGRIPTAMETQSGGAGPIPVIQVTSDVLLTMLSEAGLGEASAVKKFESQANDAALAPTPMGKLHIKFEVDMERIKADIHNVAGIIPGLGELKDQYIVVGGHYDHLGHGGMGALGPSGDDKIYFGADDNASGTAGVVMIARHFATLAAAKEQPKDRRAMLFVCFSGEERGLLGSAHMLRQMDELGIKHEQIVAMINLDMVGRMQENKLFAMGVGSGDKLEGVLKEAVKNMNLKLDMSANAAGGSDHQSFHAKNIPAIHFFTGVHRDYHKPSDTADKVNFEGGVKTVDLCTRIGAALWTSKEPIKYVQVRMAHAGAGGPRGSGAFLGIVPNYASIDAEDGCAIDGTSDGSPAAAAGLKADDVITAWDKTPVKNLRDLTAVLGASKPGQEIKLKIKRDGKEMELKVTLGTR
ncbi:MAG: M28 family peptidase [Phycisphaeraceae bacterium]